MPPFTSRERDESNPNEAPKVHYTPGEAETAKATLFMQLDEFDACAPSFSSFCPQPLTDSAQFPLHNSAPRGSLRKTQRKLHGTREILSRVGEGAIRDIYMGFLSAPAVAAD